MDSLHILLHRADSGTTRHLPDDLIKMVITFCDNEMIIKFQYKYPELLKYTCIYGNCDDLKNIVKSSNT